jgi:hypothetical protein
MEGGWFDSEAIEQERFDADLLQAQYEAEGREFARAKRRVFAALDKGDYEAAYLACPHGGGYPLRSPAALHANDPAPPEEYPEGAVRCLDCGGILTDWAWDGGDPFVPIPAEHRIAVQR